MFLKVIGIGFFVLCSVITAVAQNAGNQAASDRTLKGGGRVNPSTLAMEFSLPIGSYSGRGINVPISLNYSSKVWRLNYEGDHPVPGGNTSSCNPEYLALFAEESASGWTSSMATPYIEYTGATTFYDLEGNPVSYGDATCPTSQDEPGYNPYYIRRILVHLPSGETHEMRPDDTPIGFSDWTSDPNRPNNPGMWNATFYAVDGSNLRYVQNSANGTYRLLMPDGSYYDFDSTTAHLADRKATKFTDRNGNFTTYHSPNSSHPNGYWTDTLGRVISVPVGLQAPSAPTEPAEPIVYEMPGMSQSYKFHWKYLKGSSEATSAISDYSLSLRYFGETYGCTNGSGFPTYCEHNSGNVLFYGPSTNARVRSVGLFNPVLLSEIELPTGESYRFEYDVYGRIERIYYPTGGEEHFTYSVIPTLSVLELTDLTASANFGVTQRTLLKTAGDENPYVWTYSAGYEAPAGYRVTINNPDGTTAERYLHRGYDSSSGVSKFGYDNGLSGMAYKELAFDSAETLITQKLTHWTKKSFSNIRDWHPRVTHEEVIAYSPTGNGDAVSSTTKFEYAGDLELRETPLLLSKATQYAFVAYPNGGSFSPAIPVPGETPQPEPTPIPTPSPASSPVKIVETTYLIYDTAYSSVWANYTAQNLIGLATASVVKDGSGTVVSRSETVYDDATNYPLVTSGTPINWSAPANGYRGNPNTSRVWDSTKGDPTSSSSYISTHAQFDNFGNQIKAWDAKGNYTTTDYDSTHYAFPVQVTSPIPDTTGQHGSNSSFVTTTTYNLTTGLPLTTTDANGLETKIDYDPDTLRPIRTRTYQNSVQVGSTAETIYHDEPNNYWVKNRSQIDETNWAETITYFDGLGRGWKTERIHSDGNILVEKEFDAEGRTLRVTNPFRANETKRWITNIYDDASRVIEVVLPDGAKVKTDYGVSVSGVIGVTKLITDQAGKKRQGFTDALGRMVRVVEDPTGQNLVTDYTFDTLGNLRKTVQGEQSRYFYHDSLGRLLRAKQPEQDVNTDLALSSADPVTGHNQWSVSYEYDDNGNITETTDARGVSITGTYDNLNRIKTRNYSDSTPDVSFYYDGRGLTSIPAFSNGKTTRVASSVSETKFTSFDNLGRLLTHEQITDGKTYSTSYTYTLSGALLEETYPSGRKVKSVLDSNGEIAMLQSSKCLDGVPGTSGACTAFAGLWNYADNFTYNTAGGVTKMQLGNGRWETAKYNDREQVTEIGLGATSATQDLLKLELGYGDNTENNGSVREQKITVSTADQTPGFVATQTYLYDDLNRIQSASESIGGNQTWKQTFVIDRYGNRRFDTTNNNTTTLGSCAEAVCNPNISTARNRITTAGYQYDENGNLTRDGEGKRFEYDAENHQNAFFLADNPTSTPDATYLYDGEGRRVKKISDTETTVFVYNASGQLVAEYSTQIETVKPQVSYLTTDHLGSPRVVTDEDGRVTSRRDYTAFGEESVTPERAAALGYAGPSETRKGYTGYEKDTESGLDFAQARYYNAVHGRYTSVDPLTASATIRNPQTFNRYAYVLNSPYKFTDPLGLIPVTTGACGNSCPNSGPTVDGSNLRGRDASFDWAREWFGEVAGYELDQPNGQFGEDFSRNIAYVVAPGDGQGGGSQGRRVVALAARDSDDSSAENAFLERAKKASKEVKQFSTGSDIIQALKDFSSFGVLDDIVIHSHGFEGGIMGDGNNIGLYRQGYGQTKGAPHSQTSSTFALAVRDGQIIISRNGTITLFGCNCSNLAQELSAKLAAIGRGDVYVTGANNKVYEKNGRAAVDRMKDGISNGSRGTFITYRDGKQVKVIRSIGY